MQRLAPWISTAFLKEKGYQTWSNALRDGPVFWSIRFVLTSGVLDDAR